MDGRALALHEGEELIQEQLLFRVREPAALTASLHAAHHVLLRGRIQQQEHTEGKDTVLSEAVNENKNTPHRPEYYM